MGSTEYPESRTFPPAPCWTREWPGCLLRLDITSHSDDPAFRVMASGPHRPEVDAVDAVRLALSECTDPDGCQGILANLPLGVWRIRMEAEDAR